MIDDGDGQVTALGNATPTARKAHKCAECYRTIEPGERYFVDRYLWEGKMHNHKTCAHCNVVRQWLYEECGGWLYSGIKADIREHATSGDYPMPVLRLAVGMMWGWRTRLGRTLPVPNVPQTTLERAKGPT